MAAVAIYNPLTTDLTFSFMIVASTNDGGGMIVYYYDYSTVNQAPQIQSLTRITDSYGIVNGICFITAT